jgi:uncharacterized protein YegP (UPF0339 family)
MASATFQLIETPEGFRWRLRTDDGAVVATSDGVYDTEHAAARDVQRLKRVAADAGVESVDAESP